ncbi:MAG: ERCC4 domain-containing protein [Dehalococcoidia bacterium]
MAKTQEEGAQKCPLSLPKGWMFLGATNEFTEQHNGYEMEPMLRQHMLTGDYSLVNPEGRTLEGHVVVERKAFPDMLGCISSSRERWEANLDRLSRIESPHIVVEGSWTEILRGNYEHTRVNPNAVAGSILSWSYRYGVSIWFADTRRQGKLMTRWILTKAAIDIEAGKPRVRRA